MAIFRIKLPCVKNMEGDCVLCSLPYTFFFAGDRISAGTFKDAIIPPLKANYRLEFDQDIAMNHAREKGKP